MSFFLQRGHSGLGKLDLMSSMGLAEFAIASIIPVGLMEVGAGLRRPVDILPEIDIPVDF